MIDLRFGDCLDVMEKLDYKSIDAIIVDLPYGETSNSKDKPIPFDKLWEQYDRILKDDGIVIMFAQGLFYVDAINSNRKLYKYDLVWDKELKSGFLNAKKMPLRQHEQIIIFYKKHKTYNPIMTIGEPLHSRGRKYLKRSPTNNNYNTIENAKEDFAGNTLKYPTSIIRIQKPHPSKTLHRTEKPVELLEWLVKTYTNKGDVILDNCMGSGTTGIACINTNRNFIGIDNDKDCYELTKQRIRGILKTQKKSLVGD